MIKIASLVFDIYDDTKGEIARKLPNEYHIVKIAEHSRIEDLHDHQFALVMKTANGLRRRYPVDSPDSIKLSHAYFEQVRHTLHPALIKAAEAKFADPDTNAVAYVDVTVLEPVTEKIAFSNQVFGLNINGRECFPLHDEMLVKTAVSRFPSTMIDLVPSERFQYARNIHKQAAALNVPISDTSPIWLYTANHLNIDSLRHAIEQRKEASGFRMSTEVLDQLYLAAGCKIKQGSIETDESFRYRQKTSAVSRPLSVDKIVGVLETFDKLAGFDSEQYLRGLLDPFAACFKMAGYDSNTMMVDGVDLSKVSPERLNEKFGDEFVNEFKQNPIQVYQSSPDPIKSVIRDMAKTMGGGGVTVGQGEPSDQLNPLVSSPLKG